MASYRTPLPGILSGSGDGRVHVDGRSPAKTTASGTESIRQKMHERIDDCLDELLANERTILAVLNQRNSELVKEKDELAKGNGELKEKNEKLNAEVTTLKEAFDRISDDKVDLQQRFDSLSQFHALFAQTAQLFSGLGLLETA